MYSKEITIKGIIMKRFLLIIAAVFSLTAYANSENALRLLMALSQL